MATPAAGGKLAAKLVKVMEAVERIPKTGRNTVQNYDFVTDADVLDTLRRALIAQGVATITSATHIKSVPFTTSSGKPQFLVTVKGEITFIDQETGESFTAYGVGQGADSADKGCYKALTGMAKYALLKTFLVPTGDDPERDDNNGKRDDNNGSGARGDGSASAAAASGEAHSGSGLTEKQRGLLMARLKEVGIEGDQRKALLLDVVGKFTTKQMDSADLDKVLDALKDEAVVSRAKEIKP